MAAPSLLASTGSSADHEMARNPAPPGYESQTGRPGAASKPAAGKSKRATKPPATKRPPQRGLGVEQLERLRQQEQWKKMNEMPQLLRSGSATNFQNFQALLEQQQPAVAPTPLGGTPVQYCPPGYCVASQPPGAYMYPGQLLGTGAGQLVGAGAGRGFAYVLDQFPGNPAMTGTGGSTIAAALEPLRELSSMPNAQCVADRCDICTKQKNIGSVRNMAAFDHHINNSEWTMMSSRDFLALNMGNTFGFGGSNFSPREESYPAFHGDRRATHQVRKDVEVMGVGRKVVNAVGGGAGGNPLMEYEFFPGKSSKGRSTSPQELWLPIEEDHHQQQHHHQEAAPAYPASDSAFASGYAVKNRSGGIGGEASRDPNSIDLSLRLSY